MKMHFTLHCRGWKIDNVPQIIAFFWLEYTHFINEEFFSSFCQKLRKNLVSIR